MKLYIYIFILLLLCIFPLDAQQERSESYIRISAPVSLAGALDEIESQTNYSFIYDAQVINRRKCVNLYPGVRFSRS